MAEEESSAAELPSRVGGTLRFVVVPPSALLKDTVMEVRVTAQTTGGFGALGGALGVCAVADPPNAPRTPSAHTAATLNWYVVAGRKPATRRSHRALPRVPFLSSQTSTHSPNVPSPSSPRSPCSKTDAFDTVLICARYATTTEPSARTARR